MFWEWALVVLGYKKQIGSNDAYWFGKVGENRADTKFIRVVAGVALPILDRISGAVVVLGETYRISGPTSWIGLGACCGQWAKVENAMTQFRRDLKFDHVIVDCEQARTVIWRMQSLQFGINDIPLVTYAAPYWATGEMGRSYTNELILEDRLLLDAIRPELNNEFQMGALALNLITAWSKEHLAYYAPTRERQRGSHDILGVEGL